MMGFGGLSVHFQTLSLIAGRDIKSSPHFFVPVLSTILSAVFACTEGIYLYEKQALIRYCAL
ncbi:hypothetical protein EVA_17972 [gut metagenome]|uniref:Uncharacterized protein n=1 Tax=gut metagenome TaxID=749906 RepID=J9FG74_9ZZZZ